MIFGGEVDASKSSFNPNHTYRFTDAFTFSIGLYAEYVNLKQTIKFSGLYEDLSTQVGWC